MNPINKQWLDSHQWAADAYAMDQPPRRLSMSEAETMQKIIREEFDTGFRTDVWCDTCVKVMVLNCYNYYKSYEPK